MIWGPWAHWCHEPAHVRRYKVLLAIDIRKMWLTSLVTHMLTPSTVIIAKDFMKFVYFIMPHTRTLSWNLLCQTPDFKQSFRKFRARSQRAVGPQACARCAPWSVQHWLFLRNIQRRRSSSRARGTNRNERALKTTFSKYLLSSFPIIFAFIARYWLCVDKGVKRLGEFLSILNIKCLQLYFKAEIQ